MPCFLGSAEACDTSSAMHILPCRNMLRLCSRAPVPLPYALHFDHDGCRVSRRIPQPSNANMSSSSINNSYHKESWEQMTAIKSSIMRIWDHASPPVKLCCIKFVQRVVLAQTASNGGEQKVRSHVSSVALQQCQLTAVLSILLSMSR